MKVCGHAMTDESNKASLLEEASFDVTEDMSVTSSETGANAAEVEEDVENVEGGEAVMCDENIIATVSDKLVVHDCIDDLAWTHSCETGLAESSLCEGETVTVKCTEVGCDMTTCGSRELVSIPEVTTARCEESGIGCTSSCEATDSEGIHVVTNGAVV